ncbi:hypothetical protein [Sedimenticola selenatireducens]|uniref:Uncharacterized protein n=1 Tax=Sedimenticola selenatireducens TaxID=191960 RepID=A0A557SCI3_9GAMM|nr:hypothetical protein [Sedimenticola selenatireducens]TVO75114.1 hypothetical protein FHP88_08865 [Sedimenticola selenatireducens]TVT67031.1 MAG: hypothetical protein FHK78_01490 [Sedimenticola selenatireducens]
MQNAARELWPSEKPDAFMAAWKQAISLTGHPTLFGGNYLMGLDGYAPKIKEINQVISRLPKSKAAMIAAMVSFYNPEEGARLMAKTGCTGLGNLALHLPDAARAVLGDLLFNYHGW